MAIFPISSLTPGAHTVVAAYEVSAFCGSSESNALQRSVLATGGSILLTSSANPSGRGQPVTFTARITCDGYVPTGTVTFKDGSTVLGSASVTRAEQASLGVTTLTPGSHTIRAKYSGDANCPAGTSDPLQQTVNSSGFGFSRAAGPPLA